MNSGIQQPSPRAKEMQTLRTLLLEIPKTEIHLHLEGLVTVDTIWALMKKHDITIDAVSSKEDIEKKFKVTSLNEFIALFINVIQNCFRNDEDIEFLIADALSYLKRNNIVYAEIHFAPSKFILNGLQFDAMVEKLEKGSQQLLSTEGIDIKYLIDVSRSYGAENAVKNLELTLANPSDSIIGIGLGGTEAQGPAKEYKNVFKQARKSGLQVVAHAGEDVGPESIWDAINHLKVSRIGHGISAIQDEKLMSVLKDRQIPLEICPRSNLFTQRYVKELSEHPIRPFYDKGLYVTVNSDDPTLFGNDLVDEYMSLANGGFFTTGEILHMVKNNLFATFLPEERKQKIWEKTQKIIEKYKDSIDLS